MTVENAKSSTADLPSSLASLCNSCFNEVTVRLYWARLIVENRSVELSLASIDARDACYSSISNLLRKLMLGGGLPWSFDDPDTAEQLMHILLSVLSGTTAQSHKRL